jgi:hypothetical protein
LCIALLFAGTTQNVVIAQSTNSSARISSGTIDVTAFVGYSATGANEESGAKLRVENHTPFGARVAYNVDSHSAVEFSVANPISFYGNYVYNFSQVRNRWAPYVTGGIGGSRYGLEVGKHETGSNLTTGGPEQNQTALTGNFGAGIKYVFNRHFAVRLDVRDLIGRYNVTVGGLTDAPANSAKLGRTLNDVQFTVGIVFHLRGR